MWDVITEMDSVFPYNFLIARFLRNVPESLCVLWLLLFCFVRHLLYSVLETLKEKHKYSW